MVDQLKWLGKMEEVQFSERKFRGKESGMIYRYASQVDGLIRCRAIIFLIAIWNLYPGIVAYNSGLVGGQALLIERAIFALLFIGAGLMFNKFRTPALVLALIPACIIVLENFLVAGQINLYGIAFSLAALAFILSGFYHHFKAKGIKNKLEARQLDTALQLSEK